MKSVIEAKPVAQCFLCEHWGPLGKHHIFGGISRKWSEEYGLTAHLCKTCHTNNRKGVHADTNKAEKLHRIEQAALERAHTRQEFFNISGHYYLGKEDEQEETVSEPEEDGFFFLLDDNLWRPDWKDHPLLGQGTVL